MEYEITQQNDEILLIRLEGNVLSGNLNKEILDQVDDKILDGFKKISVNLKSVKFINSNGLNLLLGILTKARKASGEVVLVNIPKELDKLLLITKLHSIFTIRSSEEDAVAFLSELSN